MGGDFTTSPTQPTCPAQANRVGRTIWRSRRRYPSNGYSGLVAVHYHTPVSCDENRLPKPCERHLRAVTWRSILCVDRKTDAQASEAASMT